MTIKRFVLLFTLSASCAMAHTDDVTVFQNSSEVRITLRGVAPATVFTMHGDSLLPLRQAPHGFTATSENGSLSLHTFIAVPFSASDFGVEVNSSRIVKRITLLESHSSTGVISLGAPTIIRNQRVIPVVVTPYKQHGGFTELLDEVTFSVRWKNSSRSTLFSSSTNDDQEFELSYRSLIVNAAQSKGWRERTIAKHNEHITSNGWYDPTRPYLKIFVDTTGIVRISGAELKARGVPIEIIDPHSLELLNHGKSVSLGVDGDNDNILDAHDAIEFFGTMNLGSDDGVEYYNDYSNNNVYWLTWGSGSHPKRFEKIVPPQASSIALTTTTRTLHREKDFTYEMGCNENTQEELTCHKTERIPGEGWYWTTLAPGTALIDTVEVSALPENISSSMAHLAVRFRGATRDPNILNNHHLIVYVNGETVADRVFGGYTLDVITASFSLSLLHAGKNEIKIYSAGTLSRIDNIEIDWYDLTFDQLLVQPTTERILSWQRVGTASQDVSLLGLRDTAVWIFDTYEDTLTSAREFFSSNITHGTTLVAESRGYDDHRWATLRIGDSIVLSQFDRGLYVARFNESGITTALGRFDTYLSASESDSLISFINATSAGSYLAFAISDEATQNLSAAARNRLTQLGSQAAQNLGNRDSWVFCTQRGPDTLIAERYTPAGSGGARIALLIQTPGGVNSAVTFRDTLPSRPVRFYVAGSTTFFVRPHATERDNPSDLTNASNKANYIIITHKNFITEAERLRANRETTRGLTGKVIDVDDIYDEFNFGIKSPYAIRSFLRMAYSNWQAPQLLYVTLMGDATLAPLKNFDRAVKDDFIPTFGNPTSDYWYSLMNDTTLVSPIIIARMSVETSQQTHAWVDKIIEYESLPPGEWNKRVVALSGGYNPGENQILFRESRIIAEGFASLPLAGDSIFIRKQNYSTTDITLEGRVRDEVNRGALWLNFAMHGSPTKFEIEIGEPGDYSNFKKYFVAVGLSCQVANYSIPDEDAVIEKFLRAPSRGAVAAFGTTGFGFTDVDEYLIQNIVNILRQDSVLEFSRLVTLGKIRLTPLAGSSDEALAARTRNSIYQYTVLGDAALRLALRSHPELAVESPDVSAEPINSNTPGSIISEDDSLYRVRALVKNFGFATKDSVSIGLSSTATAGSVFQEQISPAIGLEKNISFTVPIAHRLGIHTITVCADNDNRYPEENENDNCGTTTALVASTRITPLALSSPTILDCKSSPSAPVLRVLNPVKTTSYTIEFELDTSKTFSSSALERSGPITPTGLVTEWHPVLPSSDTTILYYWRARSVSIKGPDAWVDATFTLNNFEGWIQQGGAAMAINDMIRVGPIASGVTLQSQHIHYALSATPGAKISGISINDSIIINNNDRERGFFVVPLKSDDITPDTIVRFDTYLDSAQSHAMAQFIGARTTNQTVLVTLCDDGTASLTDDARAALRSLGSALVDSLRFRSAYVFIGRKGAGLGSRPEIVSHENQSFTPAKLDTTLVTVPASGMMKSVVVGPSPHFKRLSWKTSNTDAQNKIVISVFGRKALSHANVLLARSEAANGSIDLSTIDTTYTSLFLTAEFLRDDLAATPTLHEWRVEYSSPAELIADGSRFTFSPKSVLEGTRVDGSATIVNVGCADAKNVLVTVVLTGGGDSARITYQETVPLIRAGSETNFPFHFTTESRRGVTTFSVNANANERTPEYFTFNNSVVGQVTVLRDTDKPVIRVYYNGVPIADGDYIPRNGEIKIELIDSSPLAVKDSVAIISSFDDQVHSYSTPGTATEIFPTGQIKIRQRYQLSGLENDEHHFIASGHDASGNRVDSISYTLFVDPSLRLENVMNFPNPMSDQTDFTFSVSGETAADGVDLILYTVAGRKIKTFTLSPPVLHVGFNKIHWDGRDADGDVIANGIYLYRLIVRSTGVVAATERLAVQR